MKSWRTIWIARLIVSDAVALKIALKHGLSQFEVEESLLCNHRVLAREIDDDLHGSRLLLYVSLDRSRALLAYIDTLNSDYSEFNLRSARVVKNRRR